MDQFSLTSCCCDFMLLWLCAAVTSCAVTSCCCDFMLLQLHVEMGWKGCIFCEGMKGAWIQKFEKFALHKCRKNSERQMDITNKSANSNWILSMPVILGHFKVGYLGYCGWHGMPAPAIVIIPACCFSSNSFPFSSCSFPFSHSIPSLPGLWY